MPCTITGLAVSLSAQNTPIPLVGAKIKVKPSNVPLFVTLSGTPREIWDPKREAITDQSGQWSVVLPWPSEQDPEVNQWRITLPDGSVWQGLVPEGVTGPLTLHTLKEVYGWELVDLSLPPTGVNLVPVSLQAPTQFRPEIVDSLPDPEDRPLKTTIVLRDIITLQYRFFINVADPTRRWASLAFDVPVFADPSQLPTPTRDGMLAIVQDAGFSSPGWQSTLGGKWYKDTLGTINAPIPRVDSFFPGVAAIGESVQVVGKNFTQSVTTVVVGGITVIDYTIIDDTHLDLVVPDGAGTGKIEVSNAIGTGKSATNLVVPPADVFGQFVAAMSGLSLWWRLNAGPYSNGQTIPDTSGNNNTTTMHGSPANITPGIVGTNPNVPQGGGTSTWISDFTQEVIGSSQGISFVFYLRYRDSFLTSNFDIGSGSSSNKGMNANIAIQSGVPKPFSIQLVSPTGGISALLISPDLVFDTRYQIAFTYDENDGMGRLYLDNTLVAGPTFMRPPGGLTIGAQNMGFARSQAWVGDLQEVMVFDRPLSTQEIEDLYDQSL